MHKEPCTIRALTESSLEVIHLGLSLDKTYLSEVEWFSGLCGGSRARSNARDA